jgi:hypothetical protein
LATTDGLAVGRDSPTLSIGSASRKCLVGMISIAISYANLRNLTRGLHAIRGRWATELIVNAQQEITMKTKLIITATLLAILTAPAAARVDGNEGHASAYPQFTKERSGQSVFVNRR